MDNKVNEIDEIKIQPKVIDFDKLVEEQLAKEQAEGNNIDTGSQSKPKFKYEKKEPRYQAKNAKSHFLNVEIRPQFRH